MKYCKRCQRTFSSDVTFCVSCGTKLIVGEGKGSFFADRLPLILGITFVVLAVALLLPTKLVAYAVDVPFITTENYTVQVPYEDLEEYTVQVPYNVNSPYVESVPVEKRSKIQYKSEAVSCSGNGDATVRITNLDTQAGSFTVTIGYINFTDAFVATTITKNIDQGQAEFFTYSPTPSSFKSCTYNVDSVPDKVEVDYKDVIKEKNETRYRDELRYRKVIKERNETRSREVRKVRTEDHTKEVNWLFGFSALIQYQS